MVIEYSNIHSERGKELEWYHGKVSFGKISKPKRAIKAASFSSPKLEREGFLLSTTYGTKKMCLLPSMRKLAWNFQEHES